jgi:hypothetical protein
VDLGEAVEAVRVSVARAAVDTGAGEAPVAPDGVQVAHTARQGVREDRARSFHIFLSHVVPRLSLDPPEQTLVFEVTMTSPETVLRRTRK